MNTTGRPLLPVPDVRPAGFSDPPTGSGLARYAAQRLKWNSCGSRLLCASVLVPLDYAEPDGTAINLFLAKVPATGPTRLGTLFVNPGGPGGSGADLAAGFRPPGLTGFDVIGWDPRGVGRSTPVTCYGAADLDRYDSVDVSPDDPREENTVLAEDRTFAVSCLQRSGSLLQHISTTETVRDLDLLRGLVGAPKLDYLGFSYGTMIGALYAQLFPGHVGRMVLDGAADITDGNSVSQVSGFERALDHFAGWCADRSCGLGGSSRTVLSGISDLLRSLDQHPLPAGRGRTLSQQQGVQAVVEPLYDGRTGWVRLAKQLKSAQRGNGAGLLRGADQANTRTSDGRYGQLPYAFPAIRCLDSQTTSVVEAERQATEANAGAPLLGPLSGPDLQCTQWPIAPAAKPPPITGRGAPTIVVVGTTGDPATPYEWAEAMAEHLDSAVLVTLDGEGHTAYGQSECVRRLVDDYLRAGVVPPKGSRC